MWHEPSYLGLSAKKILFELRPDSMLPGGVGKKLEAYPARRDALSMA